ncbi:MAG: hypothetical protein ACFFCV_16650 [Promethearchaeota archaeon]
MRKTKSKMLILLLLFPMILSLGLFATDIKGGSTIPEPSPDNSWHWGVDAGDMIIMETELIGTNFGTGGVTMVRNFDIYNITSIINETGDAMSLHPNQEFSKVMVDQLWEDSVGVLSPSINVNMPIASFGYNDTLSKEFYQPMPYSLAPMILPINDTVVDVSLMASILNETYVSPMEGFFNKFDDFIVDIGKTEFTFINSTDGYYFRASYYPNNGTIKDMDAYYLINMGAWVSFNITSKRVFDFDGTDEVVWGVSPGETYYYYVNQTGYGTYLTRLEIEGFNKAVYWSKNWTAFNILWPMVFEEVLISMSMWNGTGWQSVMTSYPLSAANNFYPMCYPILEMLTASGQLGFLIPTSATFDDFMFMVNNHTADLTTWFPFDTVYYEITGNILNMTLMQSGNGQEAHAIFNFNTGFAELQSVYYLGELFIWFEKADQLVEWGVGIGDYLYLTQNFGDSLTNKRAIITSINYAFYDVTTLGVSIPSGQPKFQFFTEIHAEFAQWLPATEEWYTYGTSILSAANEYWPFAPYLMGTSPPLLMPKGTTTTDLQYWSDSMASMYDSITYNPGHIIFRNTTANKELNMIFNETTGIFKYFGGYYYMGDWVYMSMYQEFIQNLNTGTNNFVLLDNYDMDSTVTVNIDVQVGSTTPDFIYALLPYNPIGISLPNGTALLYLDHKITNYTVIDGNVTMTVQFPSSIHFSIDTIYFWVWNVSSTSQWILPTQTIIYNYGSNSITIEFPITEPYYELYAVSVEYGPPSSSTLSSDAGVPTDDDGDFTLTWDAATGAVSYSVYEYSKFITEINGSLTSLATDITSLSHSLTGYTNGTYYFIVVAHNSAGDTLTNCISVEVAIPPEPPTDGGGTPPIPGYDLFFLALAMITVSTIAVKKVRKKK